MEPLCTSDPLASSSAEQVHLSRVEVSGEAGLCGRKGKAQFVISQQLADITRLGRHFRNFARQYFNLTLILGRNLTSSRPNLEFSLCADLLVSTSVEQVSLSRYVSEKPSFWPFLSNTLWEGHSLLRHRALLSPTVSLLLSNKVVL